MSVRFRGRRDDGTRRLCISAVFRAIPCSTGKERDVGSVKLALPLHHLQTVPYPIRALGIDRRQLGKPTIRRNQTRQDARGHWDAILLTAIKWPHSF
jgi:hypothetical protein